MVTPEPEFPDREEPPPPVEYPDVTTNQDPDMPINDSNTYTFVGGFCQEIDAEIILRYESYVLYDEVGNYYHVETYGWDGVGLGISYSETMSIAGQTIELEDIYQLDGWGVKFVASVGMWMGISGEKAYYYDVHDTIEIKRSFSPMVSMSKGMSFGVTAGPVGTFTTVEQIPYDTELIYKLTISILGKLSMGWIRKEWVEWYKNH